MFTSNPFAEHSASVPPAVMQSYVVAMALLGRTTWRGWHKARRQPKLAITAGGSLQ
jgi:hypothetical protein